MFQERTLHRELAHSTYHDIRLREAEPISKKCAPSLCWHSWQRRWPLKAASPRQLAGVVRTSVELNLARAMLLSTGVRRRRRAVAPARSADRDGVVTSRHGHGAG
jgi:hypothetical protein